MERKNISSMIAEDSDDCSEASSDQETSNSTQIEKQADEIAAC